MAGALAAALRAYEDSVVIERLREVDDYSNHRSLVWWFISANRSVTWEVVQALRGKAWNFAGLSRNPNIRWRHVLAEPNQAWDRACFYDDPQFCWPPDGAGAGAGAGVGAEPLSDALYHTNEFYRKSPHYRWRILTVLRPAVMWTDREMVKALLQNPAVVTEEALEALPDFAWEDFADALADNPAMNARLLGKLFATRPAIRAIWNWGRYSGNPALSWRTVAAYQDKPWRAYGLSMNPRVTDWARVRARPEGPIPGVAWDWNGLSRNPAVATWDRVCDHPTLPWVPEALCGNRAVARWDTCAGGAGAGAGASARRLNRDFPNNWRPTDATSTWMHLDICTPTERETFVRRWQAARRIQRVWRVVVADPAYRVCQRRLMLEWGELAGADAGA